ncbi:MBL fold metallo-hydrolase [Pistricoccus aurantiacus]|uniref:MBL fold metallo-hydrolase n=1 Tax=Pistricoccus aurantiacus TaxID=1883414 RepID=A0A5B8SU81_9GAMM|nr:MBL fold metallo-hydrolase [Pistricoccus aurantiacus]QEA40569.1 MBL fold metallo-hydrolase [Pistricoccus aurantiacus]
MNISFLGAACEATGSCFLIETSNSRFLVDCGMVEGGLDAAMRNRQPFTFAPNDIDFVLLTQAYTDHSGLLPKLCREGFTGPIHCTAATAQLLIVTLPESSHIQMQEAEYALQRKTGHGASPVATPLYTPADAYNCLRQVQLHAYEKDLQPHPSVRCRFRDAGYIPGSAILEIWLTENAHTTKIVVSGNLGQPGQPILHGPTCIEKADILLIESTYGDQLHKDRRASQEELARIIKQTRERGGNVIAPAFTIGHIQEVLYHLHRTIRERHSQNLRLFIDSPMTNAALQIILEHLELFDIAARHHPEWYAFGKNLSHLEFIASVEESKTLNRIRSGAFIASTCSMCEAGRIRHHLRHNLARPECSVLITSFQAQETLGRRLVDGARRVRLFGEDIPIKARIHTIAGLSGHADQAALLAWSAGFRHPPRQTFVVQGEVLAAQTLAARLRSTHGWRVRVPELGQRIEWNGHIDT